MASFILIFYFFLIKSANTENEVNEINEYKFYKDIDDLQQKLSKNFEEDQKKLQNSVITVLNNLKNFETLYVDFKNESTTEILNMNFRKWFPNFDISSNVNIANIMIDEFFQKYNKNDKLLLKDINTLKAWLLQDYKSLFNCLTGKIKNLIVKKRINRDNFVQLINEQIYNDFFFPERLYDFEMKVLSINYKLKAYKSINPIHELMIYEDSIKNKYSFIDMIIEKLDIYDLPSYLKTFLNDLKSKNLVISQFQESFTSIYDSFFKCLNNFAKSDNFNLKKDELFKIVFLNDQMLEANQVPILFRDIPEIFKSSIYEIQNIFQNFINKHKELKEVQSENLHNDIFDYIELLKIEDPQSKKSLKNFFKKDIKKTVKRNEEKTRKENKIMKTLSEIKWECWRFHIKYYFDLRPKFIDLIEKILDPSLIMVLNDNQRIKINNEKNKAINNKLKNEFRSFFEDIFINRDFDFCCNMFNELMNKNQKNSSDPDIAISSRKTNRFYNFDRKKEIINQIETIFTDEKIKNECFCNFLELINSGEENVDVNFQQLSSKNYKYDSVINIKLKERMFKYVNSEINFIKSMKNLISNKIKPIIPIHLENESRDDYNLDSSKKEQKITFTERNRKIILIAFILIPVIIGIIVLLILKYKIKLF